MQPLLRLADSTHDGVVSADGRIAGCYIHRLFDHPAQRSAWLARLGANEAVRQKALGHQTPQMAARYSHLELDPVAAAMQLMGDALTAAATPATTKPAAKSRRKGRAPK